jgi:hypothetical protein
MDSLPDDHRRSLLSLLPRKDLWHMLLVSKSLSLDAAIVLSGRAKSALTLFNGIHERLAQKYSEHCWFVKPNEFRVETRSGGLIMTDFEMRVMLNNTDTIDVATKRITTGYLVSTLTAFEHMSLTPHAKVRWNAVRGRDRAITLPYPDDPAAVTCNAFDDGLGLGLILSI